MNKNNKFKAYVALYQYIGIITEEKDDEIWQTVYRDHYISDVLALRICASNNEEAKEFALAQTEKDFEHPTIKTENKPRFLGIIREPELDKFLTCECLDIEDEFFCVKENNPELIEFSDSEPNPITFDEALPHFKQFIKDEQLTPEDFTIKTYKLFFNYSGSITNYDENAPAEWKGSGDYDVDYYMQDVFVAIVNARNEEEMKPLIKELKSSFEDHPADYKISGTLEYLGAERLPDDESIQTGTHQPELIEHFYCLGKKDATEIEFSDSPSEDYTLEEAKDIFEDYVNEYLKEDYSLYMNE